MSTAQPNADSGSPREGTSLTLLERLRANEPDAWQTMVQLYTPFVYRWVAGFNLRGPDADDVLQEVFRTAAVSLENFRRDRPGDTFRGWLRGIARNMCLLHFRRRSREPQAVGGTDAHNRAQEVVSPAETVDIDPDGPVEMADLHRRALERVRCEFEERTWIMFWQTVIDGRSPVVIAAEMGVTPAAVRKAKSRVLRHFKEIFGDLLR
ncbi:MAG TPA: sigma-70 family RNA polymerase sigma factor [Gemmataceae bacterium]|nr:sigma-70 family RNA polymerase sigma factor [Gemmataceae bacterium]